MNVPCKLRLVEWQRRFAKVQYFDNIREDEAVHEEQLVVIRANCRVETRPLILKKKKNQSFFFVRRLHKSE